MYRLDRWNQKRIFLSGELPWARIIGNPAIVLNKNGSLQTTFTYHGPDLDSATKEQLSVMTAQLNAAFMAFDENWALWFEAQRLPSTSYATDVYFPDPVTRAIDDERKKSFSSGVYFESHYYFTLLWYPPSDQQGKMRDFVIEGMEKTEVMAEEHIVKFCQTTGKIFKLFETLNIPIRQMTPDDMATYLHSTISSNHHRIQLPAHPILLSDYLADEPLIGGLLPRIGDMHFAAVVPLAYTPQSVFGFFDLLNRESFSYRWVSRFLCMDKRQSLDVLDKKRRGWEGKLYSLLSTLISILRGMENSGKINNNALLKFQETEQAVLNVEQDQVNYGYYSTAFLIYDTDPQALVHKAQTIEQHMEELGLRCQKEDLNAVSSWFGSIPGDVTNQLRRPLISTANLVHMVPLSDIWAGPDRNDALNGPALVYTQTDGHTPFRLNLHVGDVGHTILTGPTGNGKSVHLNLIAAQFAKYKDAQVFIFDKGASSRVLTEAVGGIFYDIVGGNDVMSFQPLAQIEDDTEAAWALDWLLDFIRSQEVSITPEINKAVWTAIQAMQALPKSQKTITTLVSSVQNQEVRDALAPLAIGGKYGGIFDAEEDHLTFSSWQSFEMEKLMEMKQAVGPVLLYLFHRLEQQLSDRPTIISLDECWTFFDNEMFAAKIRDWLKTLRKKNASVIFATQSIGDIIHAKIFLTVLDSCQSRILLPNKDALEEQNYKLYKAFGLNDREITTISRAIPKLQYYYSSPLGSRLYSLALSPLELSYLAVNSHDIKMCAKIIETYGHQDFSQHWQYYRQYGKIEMEEWEATS